MQKQAPPADLLKRFSKARKGRNAIVYCSGFWQKPNTEGAEINDYDRMGFFNLINKLVPSKGLDLILHTPGGVVDAAESIGNYLRSVFKTNIEVFVPFTAMSAGTMIACASKKFTWANNPASAL